MFDIKDYRKNWEKLSKMDITLKVNREMGRFWGLWKTIKQEPWTPEIENKFATIAYEFFEKNPRRTIVDAKEYRELLGKITKVIDDNLKEACLMSGLNAVMIYPEANDVLQLDYPNQFQDEPYQHWDTLQEQIDTIESRIIAESFNTPF